MIVAKATLKTNDAHFGFSNVAKTLARKETHGWQCLDGDCVPIISHALELRVRTSCQRDSRKRPRVKSDEMPVPTGKPEALKPNRVVIDPRGKAEYDKQLRDTMKYMKSGKNS